MNILLKNNLFRQIKISLLNQYINYKISYLQKLYQQSKQHKLPYFTVQSHHIRIIQDPLDYYLSLKKGIQSANFRIGLTCLYLGTGHLQRYLLRQIKKKKEKIKNIDVTMVFDYNRSLRQQNGQSPAKMLYLWKQGLKPQNVNVAFNRISTQSGVLGQISGVHHQKFAIFDNKIIIGGANMSQSYFLNRKDRYFQFNQCQQICDYLTQYLKILAENSYQLQNDGKLRKSKEQKLSQHLKLWQIAYRPKQFHETISQQQHYLNQRKIDIQNQQKRNIFAQEKRNKNNTTSVQLSSVGLTRNQQIAKQIGTSIKVYEQIQKVEYKQRIEHTRQNLFKVSQQQFVGNEIQILQNIKFKGQDVMQRGQKVYLFPFMHITKLKKINQPNLFRSILEIANKNHDDIKISSGYLNFSDKILKILGQKTSQKKQQNNSVEILCSAPQANSFYQGGKFKKYIPYFYRCFEIDLFKKFNSAKKISIFQFNKNDEWTFHSKGIWIKEKSSSGYLSILGSSNYNFRSQKTDTQLQLYLYSTCQKFNQRLQKQYDQTKQNCNKVQLEQLQNDTEIKCTSWIKFMSKIFKRFL